MLRYLLLFFFQCLVLLTYGQHAGGSCSSKINNKERKIFKKLPPVKDTSISGLTGIKGITIQYLGAGGILLTKGQTTIAFDPFFSNGATSYKDWYKPWKNNLVLKPDTAVINEVSGIKNLSNTEAVFITHAHYDHLLDVPYLYKKVFAKKPAIYGNTSVNYLLKNLVPSEDVINAQVKASQFSSTEIQWIKVNDNFRVMPILSDHAPHYRFIKVFDGEAIISPTVEEYYNGSDPALWKEGRTLAYLVEITENTDTFRIHIQTSACTPTDGLPPEVYMQHIGKVDISMFCMASFDNVDDYPDKLLSYLKPQKVIIVHWENFFKKYKLERKKYKVVPLTNGLCFLERMEQLLFPITVKEKCILPVPNSFIRIN